MCLKGSFELGAIEFRSHRELSLIHISLCLQDSAYNSATGALLPISGFPREVVSENRNPGMFEAYTLPVRPCKNDTRRKETTNTLYHLIEWTIQQEI